MNIQDTPFDVHILPFTFGGDGVPEINYRSDENRRL